jgi:hypothetical protein
MFNNKVTSTSLSNKHLASLSGAPEKSDLLHYSVLRCFHYGRAVKEQRKELSHFSTIVSPLLRCSPFIYSWLRVMTRSGTRTRMRYYADSKVWIRHSQWRCFPRPQLDHERLQSWKSEILVLSSSYWNFISRQSR